MRAREHPERALAATVALLVVTAAALALVAIARDSRGAAGTAGGGDPTLSELSVAATPLVARRLERLRGLAFDRVPEPEVVASAYLTRLERRELERTDGEAGIDADEAAARMLGLLPDDEQLEAVAGAGGELAAAAYDPRTDRLYVVSDSVDASPPLVEFVLAHELTHALEDEHFGLADLSAIESDDAALARLALSEGTATSAMVSYAREHLSAADLLAALDTLDSGTGAVPGFVVDQLEWTYLGGMGFVDRLRALAEGWKLVDYAIEDRPPASTEQVLHTDRYIDDDRPRTVGIPARALRERGWRLADDGDIGELATRQLLELGADDAVAAAAAAGWDGDRYELWRRGVSPAACAPPCRRELVLVARWGWDSEGDPREFARGAAGYVARGLDGERTGPGIWRVPGGAAGYGSDASSTTLVLAPNRGLALAVLGRSAP